MLRNSPIPNGPRMAHVTHNPLCFKEFSRAQSSAQIGPVGGPSPYSNYRLLLYAV